MIDKNRFLEKAKNYDIDVSHIIDELAHFATLLVDYNKKVNLTAITNPEDIENKHFLDSLLFANLNEVSGSLVDIGSGAGFPGVVTKLYKPHLNVTLMEPRTKRVDFLKFACNELGIKSDIQVVKERAEEAARKQYREQFDIAVARAVAPMNILCEYSIPLVKIGGKFIAMKGANVSEEMKDAINAASKLGANIASDKQNYYFTLPDEDKRNIIVCEKISQTASVYPRNGGKIAKNPLK